MYSPLQPITALHNPSPSPLAVSPSALAVTRTGELPETDLSCVEQIVEHSQVRTIGQAVLELPMEGDRSVRELLDILEEKISRDGIDALHPRWRVGNLAMPRPLEVAAALNRLRSLQIASSKRLDFEG